MRFELGAGEAAATLSVLAGLDLVVVVSAEPSLRVTEVAEMALVVDGYRPRLLFASGLPPVPMALVPVAAPGFAPELAQAGFGVLADELRHAVPEPRQSEPAVGNEPQPRVEAMPRRARAPAVEPSAAPPLGPGLDDSPPPGWELDQLGAELPSELDDGRTTSADDAAMAAAYGLGPPPRPSGVRPLASQGRTFQDALRRAREQGEDDPKGDDER
jgi:hypothetical protein